MTVTREKLIKSSTVALSLLLVGLFWLRSARPDPSFPAARLEISRTIEQSLKPGAPRKEVRDFFRAKGWPAFQYAASLSLYRSDSIYSAVRIANDEHGAATHIVYIEVSFAGNGRLDRIKTADGYPRASFWPDPSPSIECIEFDHAVRSGIKIGSTKGAAMDFLKSKGWSAYYNDPSHRIDSGFRVTEGHYVQAFFFLDKNDHEVTEIDINDFYIFL